MIERAAIDRMKALLDSFDACRRGGTVSISGVYGGQLDPIPMMDLFDKGLTLRMGQAHVRRWTDDILPLVTQDDDPLGTEDFATHQVRSSRRRRRTRSSSARRTAQSRS